MSGPVRSLTHATDWQRYVPGTEEAQLDKLDALVLAPRIVELVEDLRFSLRPAMRRIEPMQPHRAAVISGISMPASEWDPNRLRKLRSLRQDLSDQALLRSEAGPGTDATTYSRMLVAGHFSFEPEVIVAMAALKCVSNATSCIAQALTATKREIATKLFQADAWGIVALRCATILHSHDQRWSDALAGAAAEGARQSSHEQRREAREDNTGGRPSTASRKAGAPREHTAQMSIDDPLFAVSHAWQRTALNPGP